MHTISQTIVILSLLATYWCNGNSDVDNRQEIRQERTYRPMYSSSNVMSRSSSHSVLADAVAHSTHSSNHYDAGKHTELNNNCHSSDIGLSNLYNSFKFQVINCCSFKTYLYICTIALLYQ